MTYINESEQSAETRARNLLSKMDQSPWSVWQNLTTLRGQVREVSQLLVDTFEFLYLLPLLPGVAFEGSVGQAAWSALVLLFVRLVTGPMTFFLLRESLRATVIGWHKRSAWIFFTMVGLGVAMIPIQFGILTVVPGYLVLHGFLAWVLITTTWFVFTRGFNWLFAKVWTLPKTSPAKDTASTA